jgi:hypothetical protein
MLLIVRYKQGDRKGSPLLYTIRLDKAIYPCIDPAPPTDGHKAPHSPRHLPRPYGLLKGGGGTSGNGMLRPITFNFLRSESCA